MRGIPGPGRDARLEALFALEEPLPKISGVDGPLSPEPKPRYHGDNCYCSDCADIRAAMSIYVKNKKIYDDNGFI